MTDPTPDPPKSDDSLTAQIPQEFKDQIPDLPDPNSSKEKILTYATERLQAANSAQEHASKLRAEAEAAPDAETKKKLLAEAEKEERKSKAEMKTVNRLQSGVWQGAGMGGGMGAGLGMGIGAAVGTVVGGVVSIPTTGLGVLAGAGTGLVHGAWFKLPGADGMKENVEGKEVDGQRNEGGDEEEK